MSDLIDVILLSCNNWKIQVNIMQYLKLVYSMWWSHFNVRHWIKYNKGNAKRGVSPRLNIWPCDLDLWPWKSIGFQILLRTMYVPSLVNIHWKMLILECSQGCYVVKIWPGDLDLWPWKSIRFTRMLRKDGLTDGRKDGRTVELLYPFATPLARG